MTASHLLVLLFPSLIGAFTTPPPPAAAFTTIISHRHHHSTIRQQHRQQEDALLVSKSKCTALYSMVDDDYPSDYDAEDLEPTSKSVSVDLEEDDAAIRDALKRELLLLASVTNRGEFATPEEKDIIVDLVTQLEALNPTADPALQSEGEWDLVLSSTQSFRSSPFFMAIRAAVPDENKAMVENGFNIHDRATTASRIGHVRQIISKNLDDDDLELTSEVDVNLGILPGFPVRVRGTVITNAQLSVLPPETWNVSVKNTQVKGSNVPFLDQYLDDFPIELPVGDLYERVRGSVPVANLKTFYVDEGLRITRDVDDNFFVFSRA
eukprot:CAMPEP_0185730832 /NCGR_PEP_ID=MMETSP1171-20130828/11120_1 /TAXON_ID=374046 /ORGANISM="Helicotheca tamensis, Strain CCMP826" /LENGTH=322 /DNA_ID=CAMNT_0028399967 /DNA_START=137 /DNA_END=1105 /DNA_ORIENTATION=+